MLPIDVLSPALSRLLDKRDIVGLRNSAHTVVKLLQPVGGHSPAEALRLYSYTHPEYRETLTDFFSHEPANVLLARGTEGEVVADARRGGRIDWLHDGHQRTLVEPASGSIADDAGPAGWHQRRADRGLDPRGAGRQASRAGAIAARSRPSAPACAMARR